MDPAIFLTELKRRKVYTVAVALSLLLRSSIAQSAAMVSKSLIMWVALTLPNVAGVRVGSSRSRTCFETLAVAAPQTKCFIASNVAERCAVVAFIVYRFLLGKKAEKRH